MSTTLEYRKKQYRTIFEILCRRNPRIYIKDVASILQADSAATSRRMKEAYREGYIAGPQIRKRSYSNLPEHVYLVNCKRPVKSFKKLMKDMDVTYHAMMNGFANLWITSNRRIDIEGDVIVEGLRSDYHLSFPPNHLWKTAIGKMQDKIGVFNSRDYESKGTIETHWNEIIPWDSQDEKLFREFKYNLRKKVTPIMRKHHISGEKLYKWLGRLSECCTVSTCYYPEKFSAYDSFLYMFETDYEDFIIDLFSELPTSSFFFKVSDKLFLYAQVAGHLVRLIDVHDTGVGQLQIPLLIEELLDRRIIKREAHTNVECYWGKAL